MLTAGLQRKTNGVIFTGVSETEAKAHSEKDTSGVYPVNTKISGDILIFPRRGEKRYALSANSWIEAAKMIKEEHFSVTDKLLQDLTDQRTEYDALPANENGRGKQSGNVLLDHNRDGNITAVSTEDTAKSNPITTTYENGRISFETSDGRKHHLATWSVAIPILSQIFSTHDTAKAKEAELKTSYSDLDAL